MQLLENLLGSKIKIKILRKLCEEIGWPFNIVELAEALNLNKGVVSRVLNQLQKEDIVRMTVKGRIKLCRINRNNKIIKELIIPLFEKERRIPEEIFKTFIKELKPKKYKTIISVLVYGSVIKEKFKLTSDVDFMIILSNNTENEKIKRILDNIGEKFSKEDIIVFYDLITKNNFSKLYNQNEPAIRDIVKFNKLLYGKDALELI